MSPNYPIVAIAHAALEVIALWVVMVVFLQPRSDVGWPLYLLALLATFLLRTALRKLMKPLFERAAPGYEVFFTRLHLAKLERGSSGPMCKAIGLINTAKREIIWAGSNLDAVAHRRLVIEAVSPELSIEACHLEVASYPLTDEENLSYARHLERHTKTQGYTATPDISFHRYAVLRRVDDDVDLILWGPSPEEAIDGLINLLEDPDVDQGPDVTWAIVPSTFLAISPLRWHVAPPRPSDENDTGDAEPPVAADA